MVHHVYLYVYVCVCEYGDQAWFIMCTCVCVHVCACEYRGQAWFIIGNFLPLLSLRQGLSLARISPRKPGWQFSKS